MNGYQGNPIDELAKKKKKQVTFTNKMPTNHPKAKKNQNQYPVVGFQKLGKQILSFSPVKVGSPL